MDEINEIRHRLKSLNSSMIDGDEWDLWVDAFEVKSLAKGYNSGLVAGKLSAKSKKIQQVKAFKKLLEAELHPYSKNYIMKKLDECFYDCKEE